MSDPQAGRPKEPACVKCGETKRLFVVQSEITGRWWILCQAPDCGHPAAAT